jgi:hypothetical protein
MRKHHAYTLAVVILMTGVGCARKGNPPQQDQPVETGAMGHTQQRVSLRGCVQAAPGFEEFVLHGVSIAADRLAEQEAIAERALIPPGSWVRLQSGTADLRSYLGKEVSLVGRIVDTGANTIGTSTPPARPTDRAMPPSTVPPAAADANGGPPQIAVEQITAVGKTCE